MKTILESFLDALDIRYTKGFARTLYQEHPHKYNMFGLKKMLDVYGVKTLGVHFDDKDLSGLNYPCLLHTSGDFVIGLDHDAEGLTCLQHGKKTKISHDEFKRMWTGNALVVEETTEASEPDWHEHLREELVSMLKVLSIPILLAGVALLGTIHNYPYMDVSRTVYMALAIVGIWICSLLMEKQLTGESRYGDRVCSLFHHADCSSVLDGPRAKVMGISWSEVGLGYFIAILLLVSLYPDSCGPVAAVNALAMIYGIWSVGYQWRVAKSWCVLCFMVQGIIWLMGIIAAFSFGAEVWTVGAFSSMISCMVFAAGIMLVHQLASARVSEQKRVECVQRFRALKANSAVAKVLIEKGEYFEASSDDSSIIFGCPEAPMRVTILSNPHCNPCARMHKRVEHLLDLSGKDICVQYIFSSFNERLEDSSRYLIAVYQKDGEQKAREVYSRWYAGEKRDYETIVKLHEKEIHAPEVECELKRHQAWREKSGLVATPTVLVNGYKLPNEYTLEDLALMTTCQVGTNS